MSIRSRDSTIHSHASLRVRRTTSSSRFSSSCCTSLEARRQGARKRGRGGRRRGEGSRKGKGEGTKRGRGVRSGEGSRKGRGEGKKRGRVCAAGRSSRPPTWCPPFCKWYELFCASLNSAIIFIFFDYPLMYSIEESLHVCPTHVSLAVCAVFFCSPFIRTAFMRARPSCSVEYYSE